MEIYDIEFSDKYTHTHTGRQRVSETLLPQCTRTPARARLRADGEESVMGGGATVYGGFYITSCHIFFGLSRRRRQLVYADAESVTFFFSYTVFIIILHIPPARLFNPFPRKNSTRPSPIHGHYECRARSSIAARNIIARHPSR